MKMLLIYSRTVGHGEEYFCNRGVDPIPMRKVKHQIIDILYCAPYSSTTCVSRTCIRTLVQVYRTICAHWFQFYMQSEHALSFLCLYLADVKTGLKSQIKQPTMFMMQVKQ